MALESRMMPLLLSQSKRTSKDVHRYHQCAFISAQPLPSSDSIVILSKSHFQEFSQLNKPSLQYRNSRTGARSTRTQIDHDVFEGLPVRHWRKRPIKVDTAPEKENVDETDPARLQWKELQMPRDYHLLPQASQELLRAARMPQVKKQAAPLMEDEKELGEEEDADGEIDTGFVAKRWALVPKEMERPEPEFLAKRRKGLPSAHSGALGSLNTIAPMRKTKIRKMDTDGHSSVWEVLVPDGQTVDGEVVEEETTPTQAPAPGTVLEGVGVVNAEGVVIAGDQGVPAVNKRRPPPPKRKPKGPGRGRKKKVAFAGADGLPTTNAPDGSANSAINIEDGNGVGGEQGPPGGDTEMGDGSLPKDGDQEGEEGSEEGSEDDEGDEGDREEGELSPSASPYRSSPKPLLPNLAEASTLSEAQDPGMPQSPPSDRLASAIESSWEGLTEATTKQENGRMDAHMDEPMDEMLDEPIDERMSEYEEPVDEFLDESTKEAVPQHHSDLPAENGQGIATTSVAEPVVDAPSHVHTEDRAYKPEYMDDPPTQVIAQSTTEPSGEQVQERITLLSASTLAEPTAYATAAPPIGTSTIPATEPATEPATDTIEESATMSAAETKVKGILGQTAEITQAAPPKAIPSDTGEAKMVPATEVETGKGLIAMQENEATSQPLMKVMPESTSQALIEPGTEVAADVQAEPPSKPALGPSPELKNELVDEQKYDPLAEAIQEHTERKYALTRPTASPKAPTPSPPTPIETKFSTLQAPEGPYVSPKAPTMSPPTPIERSMSSSPEMPLSGQPFQLPPQIDMAREARSHPILHQVPHDSRIVVEASPEVEPRVNAQIPVDHDPLDGMAEPAISERRHGQEADGGSTAHFSDGEEDLLGDLERSLGSRSHGC